MINTWLHYDYKWNCLDKPQWSCWFQRTFPPPPPHHHHELRRVRRSAYSLTLRLKLILQVIMPISCQPQILLPALVLMLTASRCNCVTCCSPSYWEYYPRHRVASPVKYVLVVLLLCSHLHACVTFFKSPVAVAVVACWWSGCLFWLWCVCVHPWSVYVANLIRIVFGNARNACGWVG